MGPHFFKCGKIQYNYRADGLRMLLQWGRTFSSAERSINGDVLGGVFKRFNGAALFQVRKDQSKRFEERLSRGLQWGRTFSSAERE